MNVNWYALPLVVVISFVYSASRFERWPFIVHHAIRVMLIILALLAGVLAVLVNPPSVLACGLAIAFSYVVGSIPFGFLAGKARGIDIRQQGSGNIGATNASRVLGWPFGIAVFVLDALKGVIATACFPRLFAMVPAPPAQLIWFSQHVLPVLCGLGAILGHTFPFWLNYRGGKGVATSLGVMAVLAPLATGVAAAVWGISLLVCRYVSLSSILAVLAFAVSYFIMIIAAHRLSSPDHLSISCFALVAALLVIWRHRDNIERLRRGTENRVHLPYLRNPTPLKNAER